MNSNSMELNIQRFAEGGSDGGSSESATVAQSQETGENAGNTADNTSVAGENNGAKEEVTLDSIFEKHPELKKEADKRTQKAVQGRVHQINKSMQSQNDIIDKLMVHHGVETIDELSQILDSSIKEEFALQNGVSEETGEELFNFRLKNMQDSRMRGFYEAQREAEQKYGAWKEEADKVKEIYPDFDLETELQNPEFGKMLKVNVPMEHIYEMLHHKEIVEAAKKNAASMYAKSTQQIASRPAENGLGNQTAVNGVKDVSKLTKKERAEFAKRAQRGESITF